MSERDPDRMLEALNGAVGAVNFGEEELEARLGEVVDVATRVFGVAGAGMMLLNAQDQLALVGASSDVARALERAQQEAGVGPGFATVENEQVVIVEDLIVDPRWPRLSKSLAGLEVGGVLSAPIRMRERVVGNLNLLESTARIWTGADVSRARTLADVAAVSLQAALDAHAKGRLISELQRALNDSRPTQELSDSSWSERVARQGRRD